MNQTLINMYVYAHACIQVHAVQVACQFTHDSSRQMQCDMLLSPSALLLAYLSISMRRASSSFSKNRSSTVAGGIRSRTKADKDS